MEASAVYYSIALIILVFVALGMKWYTKTEDTPQPTSVRRGRQKSSSFTAWEMKKQLSKSTDNDSDDDVMTET
jgi:hypothetical protein